jgi:hypothetical protein
MPLLLEAAALAKSGERRRILEEGQARKEGRKGKEGKARRLKEVVT